MGIRKRLVCGYSTEGSVANTARDNKPIVEHISLPLEACQKRLRVMSSNKISPPYLVVFGPSEINFNLMIPSANSQFSNNSLFYSMNWCSLIVSNKYLNLIALIFVAFFWFNPFKFG